MSEIDDAGGMRWRFREGSYPEGSSHNLMPILPYCSDAELWQICHEPGPGTPGHP